MGRCEPHLPITVGDYARRASRLEEHKIWRAAWALQTALGSHRMIAISFWNTRRHKHIKSRISDGSYHLTLTRRLASSGGISKEVPGSSIPLIAPTTPKSSINFTQCHLAFRLGIYDWHGNLDHFSTRNASPKHREQVRAQSSYLLSPRSNLILSSALAQQHVSSSLVLLSLISTLHLPHNNTDLLSYRCSLPEVRKRDRVLQW